MVVQDSENWFLVPCLLVAVAAALWWRWKHLRQARQWPETVATIHSGAVEIVSASEYHEDRAPVFAFSYRVGDEYYAGRFSLQSPTPQLVDSLIQRMIGRTLDIRYNPRRPQRWLIPVDRIEGYAVRRHKI